MNNLPKIGSIWSHHTNGGEYVVYDITNENTQNEKYPINISYRGANGRKWSKPLDNFLRTMVESEENSEPHELLLSLCDLISNGHSTSDILKSRTWNDRLRDYFERTESEE